jgi:lysozyme
MEQMTTSENGRKMIEGFEGLALKAYADQKGVPTLGYGHTASVKLGDTCTPQQADVWITGDLATAEEAVNRLVTVPINQNQFDALVSFTFNEGQGHLGSSTLLSLLNQGATTGAANQFLAWVYVNGVKDNGLLNRRKAERLLFLTPETA